jgi:hypothetical protein
MSLTNVCHPMFKGGDPITGHTSAAVVGKTFADISATIQSGPNITTVALSTTFDGGNIVVATCAAKKRAIGVFAYDRAINEPVPILYSAGAILPLTSGEALTAGEEVEVGAGGKPVKLAAGIAVGKVVTTAGNNEDVFIRLY